MKQNKIIVAIDGFSSCGKSTMAKKLAAETGYSYIDTGAMYRAVALYAMRAGYMSATDIDQTALLSHLHEIKITFRQTPQGNTTFLNGENVESLIRTLEIADGASRVSTIKEVRTYLVSLQQQMGIEKGIVMDGRDIGTVVFPNAELKIFLTASPEVRASRRYKELSAKGDTTTYAEVLAAVRERDQRDINRKESPLKQAPDALILDNSDLTFDEQQEWLRQQFQIAINKPSK